MKRVVVLSDFHCGSKVGLTPPEYQYDLDTPAGAVQKLYWDFFKENTEALKPIDLLILNGDAIDGTGERQGGTDQKTTDRAEQMKMARRCIEVCEPGALLMTYGTPYHVGASEDWEGELLEKCRETMGLSEARIGANEDAEVNGLVINCKHSVGGSQIPHGRHTAVARERLWNQLWAERGQRPKADILIRSHVHYLAYCGGPDWLALTTPGLQGLGSKYGTRQCSGIVDFGFVYFEVESREKWWWGERIMPLSAVPAKPMVV